jgi:signal recognition particle receptor subunit beta
MVQINFAQKNVSAKIVYYGPGMSGKTTNLEVVHQRAPDQNKGELTSISTDGDRTLFFDFKPLDLGTVAGMRTCFQIYTVPGQVYYNSTRKLVLQGVDGVVFVADSGAGMLQENLDSLKNLEENLNEYGKSLSTLPHVIQFNKRDLPDAMPVDQLNAHLNPYGAPCFEAVANTGQGVFPTLKALAARVLETIHAGSGGSSRSQAPAAPAPARPNAPAPAQPVAMHPPQAAPVAPLPRVAQPAPMQQPAYAAAQPQPQLVRTGFQPQPIVAPPQYPAMQAPVPMQPQMAVPTAQQPQLVQSGFHQPTATAQQQYAQPVQHAPQAPVQHAQPSGPLHMARVSVPSGNSASGASMSAAASADPARKPRAAASAKTAPRQNNGPLEGTRFRPRTQPAGAPRPEPRATPSIGAGNMRMGLILGAALLVGAGAAVAILSLF